MIDVLADSPLMLILLGILFMILAFNGYFILAKKYHLVDRPNERSSHSKVTIVGAGIVFFLAIALALFMLYLIHDYWYLPYLSIGILAIAVTSFIDDRKELPSSIRLSVQLIASLLLVNELGIQLSFNWYTIAILLIIVIGAINAYNFMDGINGITGLYSAVCLISLYYLRPNSELDLLYYYLAIAIAVFLFYNFRLKAICFCGDVGSITLAFILVYLLLKYMLSTNHWEAILLLAVYGVDSVLTILYRLGKRENIFKAHRSHIYQLLVHNKGLSHLKVSSIYAALQLTINIILIASLNMSLAIRITVALLVLLILSLTAIILRRKLTI